MNTDPRIFAGRVALVTGGSDGIGAALCQRLSHAGAQVAVHCRSDRSSAERVVASIQAAGGQAAVFAADLIDPDAAERLVDRVQAGLGPVDVLAANAGLSRTRHL